MRQLIKDIYNTIFSMYKGSLEWFIHVLLSIYVTISTRVQAGPQNRSYMHLLANVLH